MLKIRKSRISIEETSSVFVEETLVHETIIMNITIHKFWGHQILQNGKFPQNKHISSFYFWIILNLIKETLGKLKKKKVHIMEISVSN